MSHLNWTNAFAGRLRHTALDSPSFAGRAEAFAGRLGAELAAGTLPFINMPYRAGLEAALPEVMERFKGLKHMLLLGIGGSALGPRALQKAFFPRQDWPNHQGPRLWILDNVDAETLEAWLAALPPAETLVVAVSKSGGTIETMAQYFLARKWLTDALGADWTKHVLLITDEKNGQLRAEANEKGLAALPVPDNLGGRYSVLSAVGLVPAYFCGLDWKALMGGAAEVMAPLCASPAGLKDHPAWKLALWARELQHNDYSQLIFFSYIPLWSCLGAWFAQLWAESLGKEGKGSMPLPAVGVTDQHSTQQMFLDGPRDKGCLFLTCPALAQGRSFGPDLPDHWSWLRGRRFGELLQAEALGTRMALTQCATPLVELRMDSPGEASAGGLIALLELTTLFCGWLLDINPLDQPAVELGKRLANARLGAGGYSKESALLAEFLAARENLQSF